MFGGGDGSGPTGAGQRPGWVGRGRRRRRRRLDAFCHAEVSQDMLTASRQLHIATIYRHPRHGC